MIEQAARGWERNPARSLKILTYSLPLGQGQAHDEDDEEACHIVELGGWLNVAAKHGWRDYRWRGEGELFYRGKRDCGRALGTSPQSTGNFLSIIIS